MGMALEVITGFVTAPGAAFTAWTLAAGNSLTIRNTPVESEILLLGVWADNQAAGTLRIRSPKLHDNVQGLRFDLTAGDPTPLFPLGYPQALLPQDELVAEQTGSAVAGDIETGALLLWYQDLPGVEGRYLRTAEVMPRIRHIFTVENTLAFGATGGYSGEETVNAEFDLWKANVDYALLGYLVDGECAVVRWRGSDTGNLGVGGPGVEDNRDLTSTWFTMLSSMYDRPLVPVFNAANKDGILVDGAQDEDATNVTVTSIFAELAAG